jgi:mono/diheme cytochrome c family protein
MAKVLRWAGYLLAALLVLLLLAAGWVWVASSRVLASRVDPVAERLLQPTAAQLADGERQLRILGCLSCHGDKLEGEAFIDDAKVALLHAPNLTRVAAKASDQQLAQAIRQGIGVDGRTLLVMPSESYQFLSDQEVAALIAAIRQSPVTGTDQPPLRIGPIGRYALARGRLPAAPALVEQYRSSRIADLGPQFALGRHLVETNCSGCHGPDLKGKELEPGTVSADLAMTGAYDLDQFRAMLRTGAAPGGKKLGLMAKVAKEDFRHLRDDEIAAVHAYLVERARRAP